MTVWAFSKNASQDEIKSLSNYLKNILNINRSLVLRKVQGSSKQQKDFGDGKNENIMTNMLLQVAELASVAEQVVLIGFDGAGFGGFLKISSLVSFGGGAGDA